MLENGCSSTQTSILGRVVKAMDLSPIGQCPREFEPRRMQLLFFWAFVFLFVWVGEKKKKKKSKKRVFEPRIELGTFCVLGRRDNQLHHPNATGSLVQQSPYCIILALVTQSVEYWSYEPKVMGSSPI